MPSVTSGGGNGYIQAQGAKELARSLRKAGADMKNLKAENKKAADMVAPAAKTNVDAYSRSGRLRDSVRSGATQQMGIVRAGKKAVPYAGAIEFGWPKQGIKAHHSIVDAAHDTEPLWVEIYRDAVNKILNQIYGA